jgi:hypothetical protein
MKINFNKVTKLYNEVCDQFLETDVIGTNAKLYFPPTFETCVNCANSQYGNSYKSGGPMPFNHGSCPMCGGTCQKEIEYTDDIRVRAYSRDAESFSKRRFQRMGISIDVPKAELFTIFYLADAYKVKLCNYAKILDARYSPITLPQPHGFGKDRYAFCFWELV